MSEPVDLLPMNHAAMYHRLLYNAAEIAHKIDRFDLHSEDPESVKAWNALIARAREDHLELVRFCQLHFDTLFREIEELTEPKP